MSNPRPGGVTLVCVLAVLGALLDLILAQKNLGDFETARWVDEHPQQARFEQLYSYFGAGLTLLASYFMLQAHNWARWLYLGWNTARLGLAVALLFLPAGQGNLAFLRFHTGMIPSAAFFILALWLLCRADAREYFANGRKPWWRE